VKEAKVKKRNLKKEKKRKKDFLGTNCVESFGWIFLTK